MTNTFESRLISSSIAVFIESRTVNLCVAKFYLIGNLENACIDRIRFKLYIFLYLYFLILFTNIII
jgi:hypothetical protein